MKDHFSDLLMINQTLNRIVQELGAIDQTLNRLLVVYVGTVAKSEQQRGPLPTVTVPDRFDDYRVQEGDYSDLTLSAQTEWRNE